MCPTVLCEKNYTGGLHIARAFMLKKLVFPAVLESVVTANFSLRDFRSTDVNPSQTEKIYWGLDM